MKFPDVLGTIATEPGILSPGSDVMFMWPDFRQVTGGYYRIVQYSMCGLGGICRTWCVWLLKGQIWVLCIAGRVWVYSPRTHCGFGWIIQSFSEW